MSWQVRYLFDTVYKGDHQLFAVEFQEFAHFVSALKPEQLNRFYVNATDLIHAQFNTRNMTYATAKQVKLILPLYSTRNHGL